MLLICSFNLVLKNSVKVFFFFEKQISGSLFISDFYFQFKVQLIEIRLNKTAFFSSVSLALFVGKSLPEETSY